jgi:serine/threonine-protein kinase
MLPAAGVKVVDFGISALVGEEADAAPDGKLLGTPAYVAPERLIGAPVGPASDVYALGVLLHVALTGRLPWQVDGSRLLRAHLELPPDALPLVDGMPGEVAELYQDCLAKDPAERPVAEQVAARLTAAAGASVPLLNVIAAPASVMPAPASVSPAPSGWAGTDMSQLTAFLPLTVGNTMPVAATTASNTVSRSGPAGVRRWLAGAGTTPRRTGGIVLILFALLATGAALATDGRGEASTGILAAAAPDACRVTYQIRDDTAGKFSGTVTVSNLGPRTLTGWTVSFNMPGDQQLEPGDPPVWGQTGQAVTLRPGAGVALPDHHEATFPFSGAHGATNPLPVAFALNGAPCEVQLLGPSGVATTAAQAGTVSAAPSATAPSARPSPTKGTKHGKGKDGGGGGNG